MNGGSWRAADLAQDTRKFTSYLERVSEHRNVRDRSRARLVSARLRRATTVLDLGCGIGSNALMLAEFVGPLGRVHVLDQNRTMLDITAHRAAERGMAVICHEADAAALPFPDRSFDAVWMERVLLHVPSPAAVMREILRVLRPDGLLVSAEPDNAAVRFCDGDDPALARLVERCWAEGTAHPRIGRSLARLARAAGFASVRGEQQTVLLRDFDFASVRFRWRDHLLALIAEGEISEERADAWWATVEAQAQAEEVVATASLFDLFARR